jgi:hypothetical protein
MDKKVFMTLGSDRVEAGDPQHWQRRHHVEGGPHPVLETWSRAGVDLSDPDPLQPQHDLPVVDLQLDQLKKRI